MGPRSSNLPPRSWISSAAHAAAHRRSTARGRRARTRRVAIVVAAVFASCLSVGPRAAAAEGGTPSARTAIGGAKPAPSGAEVGRTPDANPTATSRSDAAAPTPRPVSDVVLSSGRVRAPRPDVDATRPHESLPALARDDAGAVYLALVERQNDGSAIAVLHASGGVVERVATLGAGELRAPGRPAMVGLANGALVAFSAAEPGGRHRIYYARIGGGGDAVPRAVAEDGTRAILPALARSGDRVVLVWESNADAHGRRRIRATTIAGDGTHDAPVTLSAASANSNNPDVVATPGGAVAVWDSLRDGDWDLYGARLANGRWSAERRLTRDPRLERHVSLAAQGEVVWLAWQAESFAGNDVLSLSERRVLLGRLASDDGVTDVVEVPPAALRSRLPQDSGGDVRRPHLLAAPDGRLWVTARQSLGRHSGWAAIARSYANGAFGPEALLLERQGRWPKVALIADGNRLLAAAQWDTQGMSFPEETAEQGDVPSAVALIAFPPPPATPETPAKPPPPTTFRASDRVMRSNAALPRQTRTWRGKTLSLYWGNLHAHSALSTCDRSTDPPPEDVLVIERDLDRLDFCALTDHDFSLDQPSWAYTQEAVARYDDPGFVALLGQEWTSGSMPPLRAAETPRIMRHGHHNLIFRSDRFPRFADSTGSRERSPQDVFAMLGDEDFVLIPHALADWQFRGIANPPIDWESVDEVHSPLAEIFQKRGSYECLGCPRQASRGAPFAGRYLRDAWSRGHVIGTIAAPDHGGGAGYAGVWAEDLSAAGLFRAFHARHTFGTTGEKTAIFFTAGDGMMGDKIERKGDGPVELELWASSATPIEEVRVFRNGETIVRATPGERELELRWTDHPPAGLDPVWYYVRVHAAVGTPGETEPRLAWSSPVWLYDEVPLPRRTVGEVGRR